MNIFYNKKNYLILSFCFLCIFSFFQVSCSSNSILTENLELTLPAQKQMTSNVKRNNDLLYLSNLKNYSPPSENQLIEEAKFSNLKLYNESAKVLSDWVLKNLSQKEKNQLSKNCEILVGPFKNQFPLNEQTLVCAAWWLEKKNNDEITKNRLSSSSISSTKHLSHSQKKDWKNYKGMSFSDSFIQIEPHNFTQAKNITLKAIEYASDCSYVGAESALILRLESFLPNKEVYPFIEKIYTNMDKCLVPNVEPSEKIHLRVGLLRLLLGNHTLAQKSLEKALLENEPSESSRSLFWLGTIYQKSNNIEAKNNPYWQRLIKENPISLAAVLASQQMEIDPLNNLVADEDIMVQARESSVWNDNNLEAFIFDLFRSRKETSAAAEWASFVGRSTSVTNPNLILYWALAQNSVNNFHYSIFMLGRYNKYSKNYSMSRTLLNLHFPKPYLKEISEYADDLDPLLVLSLIRQESAFDANAHSAANARGLMQILPSTAKSIKRKLNSKQLYDPETNLEIGIAYLNRLLKRYDGRIEYVLASYNAGATNLDKWRERTLNDNMMLFCDFMPFKETRSYVSIILRNYYWYSRLLSEKDDLFSKKVLQQSAKARWKSDRIAALLSFTWQTPTFEPKQKELLDRIYIFGKKNSNITSNIPDWLNTNQFQNKSYQSPINENKSLDQFNY